MRHLESDHTRVVAALVLLALVIGGVVQLVRPDGAERGQAGEDGHDHAAHDHTDDHTDSADLQPIDPEIIEKVEQGVIPAGDLSGLRHRHGPDEEEARRHQVMHRIELLDAQPPEPLAPMATTTCSGGMAGSYPCSQVNLHSFTPLSQIGGSSGNDIWGWTDPSDGKEYAIMGRKSGTAFVDISDPASPVYLGNLPTHSSNSTWRDIKTYDSHAFIVSEAGSHGMQVFDLTTLRNVGNPPTTFSETAHFSGFQTAHNIVIDEASGYGYAVGANACSGGLYAMDLSTPTSPTFAGCFSSDGYTHDAQCVTYDGPDATYTGKEICLAANVDTLTIVDVTSKSSPVQISKTGYAGNAYAHQLWLTPDHKYVLLDDETDEYFNGHNTRTYVMDVSNLNAPSLVGSYTGPTSAIDHNLYVAGDFAYEANYRAGLRILDLDNIATASLTQAGYFDIYPSSNSPNFNGAWSVYPFFPSGNVVVSGIEQGLFVLQPLVDPDFRLDTVPKNTVFACRDQTTQPSVEVDDKQGYSGSVTLSDGGLPAGVSTSFGTNPVAVPGLATWSITATLGTPLGDHTVTITGTDSTVTHTLEVTMAVTDTLGPPTLLDPPKGATEVDIDPTLTWQAVGGAQSFELQLATDSGFTDVITTATGITATSFDPPAPLAGSTEHHWRVRTSNTCGTGGWSAARSFTTIATTINGDCNADGTVDAADISALVLELFDDDGTDAGDAGGGTFAGDPDGCDTNDDTQIDAADISCLVLIVFGGACGS